MKIKFYHNKKILSKIKKGLNLFNNYKLMKTSKNLILIEMCERCDGYTPLSYNTYTKKYELCDIQDVEIILDEETRNLISEKNGEHINEGKINEETLTARW